ncbi:MAG TPA: TonB-dependent receptor, partial [Labilithrix sp.]|nr:TonB-dependent receptor [Labilithrix sp.]
ATNIGRARLFGLEAELRASAFGFDTRISHTALATANESECTTPSTPSTSFRCERPPLTGRPAHDFVADLAWARGPLRVRYGIDAVTGIFADLTGTIEVPARVLHNAGVRLSIPGVRGLSLSFDVRNLFHLRAVDYPGFAGPVRAPIGDLYDFPLPGRSILLSARWAAAGR